MMLLIALLAGPGYLYPLQHTPQVTSTFGTFRIGHHHAGLDLTTDNNETVPVLAAADGELYRVRRNDAGYGLSVFVRHPDGRQTVYAHLSGFAPKVAEAVKARELKENQFFLAFSLKGIPVKRGEVLGWVGTSGTDLVHLHFEVREGGQPVNPLTHGLQIPDTQAPQIRKIIAVPRTPTAHVNGAHDEFEAAVVGGKVAAPLRVEGDVVLYVEAPDRIDGSERDLVAHRLELRIDGDPWHITQYEQVSYADERLPELDFHLGRHVRKEGVVNALFSQGPRQSVHAKPGKSLAKLSKGTHQAHLLVSDAAGNRSEVKFELVVGAAEAVCPGAPPAAGGKVREVPPPADRLWRGALLVLPIADLCGRPVKAQLNGKPAKLRPTRLGGQTAVALAMPTEESATLVVTAGDERFTVRSHGVKHGAAIESGDVRFEVPKKDALFFSYPTEITQETNPGAPGLEVVGPLWRMSNRTVPALGGSRLGLRRPPGGTGHVGVYLKDRDRWWLIGGSDGDTHTFGVSAHAADVALMRDTEDPVVGEPVVEPHPAGPRMIVPVKDAGAGVSVVDVQVDGKPAFTERQRAFDRVIWHPLKPVKPGTHRVDVRVRDRSGREVEVKRSVVWPEAGVKPE